MIARDRLAIFIWLALVAGGAWVFAFHTRIATDLTGFLPRSAGATERLLMQQLKDGVASRLILIGIDTAPSTDLAALSKGLAEKLRTDPLFAYVGNGADALSAADRQLLFQNRYLLSPAVTAPHFGAPALRAALQARLAELASPFGAMTKELLARDPTGEFLRVAQNLVQPTGPAVRDGVWFARDTERALMVVETRAAGFDADAQQHAIDAIRHDYDALNPRTARLSLTGPGVFAAASKATIERDSWRLSAIAAVLVLVILLSAYRSGHAVLLGMLPVVTGLIVGIAGVSLLFGSVHGITLGFGATLIGEAVDYPSYLFTGVGPGESVRAALRRIWPTLRLAVLTTVFGSLAMLLSSFTGLAQLGLLSIAGVFTAGLVTRWVLPALAPQQFGLRKAQQLPAPISAALVRARHGAWIAWMLLLVSCAVLALKHDRLWDDDLANMSPVPESEKALDQTLRNELGAPDVRYLIAVSGDNREDALRRSEEVAAQLQDLIAREALSGFDMAAKYLPSQETQRARKASLPSAAALQSALDRALRGTPFKKGLFAPFVADVAAAKNGKSLTASDFKNSALGLKVRSLLIDNGSRPVALLSLTGVRNIDALTTQFAHTPHVAVLDKKTAIDHMVGSYRNESLRLTALGVAAIVLVLWVGLRDIKAVVRVMTPILIAVLATVATLLALGERLSLFHLVSLLLVIGIGTNYALFFNRNDEDADARRRTELSLAVCGASTLSAFGALAFSQTSVLHAIGLTVSLGAVFSMLVSMLLARIER